MIKIKIKSKKQEEKSVINSGPNTFQRAISAGEPDGASGVPVMNTMEECGMDYPVDEYGKSPTGNPDLNGDGIYSPSELYYHFDLNQDGTVSPDEYEQHVKWHARHPEVFDYKDEQEQYYELDEASLLQLTEKKDRCYYQAKRKYKVFPSAYASGYIVRCRKGKVGKKK